MLKSAFRRLFFVLLVGAAGTTPAFADCVYGAQSKTSFTVLDSRTIMLTGGYGPDIIIRTYTYLSRYANVSVLKDSFCSYENAVLYVDGQVVDASQVTAVR